MKSVFAVNGDEVNICLSICLFIYIYILEQYLAYSKCYICLRRYYDESWASNISAVKQFAYFNNVFIYFKKYLFIYLSGCVGSQLRHAGSLLRYAAFFIVVRGLLSSCGTRAQLPHSMWNLSSPTRDQTRVPCIVRWILNHWTTREVPQTVYLIPQSWAFWFLGFNGHWKPGTMDWRFGCSSIDGGWAPFSHSCKTQVI